MCLLGNLNLTQFVLPGGGWDYEKLGRVIPVAVRFMDNVNDVSYVPLEIQKENLHAKRRIGLGIMGYASALIMMKVRYGSDEALKLTDELMHFIVNTAYGASAMLAAEKGSFPAYDKEKYICGNFIKKLDDATLELILKYGMRNSHITTIAPTGNTSSMANVVSGGNEPVFRPSYYRTKIIVHWPVNLPMPVNVNFADKTFESSPEGMSLWQWTREGDENMLRCEFKEGEDTLVYKCDQNRGLTKESRVIDYGVAYLEKNGGYDANADYAVDAAKLTIDDHINTMAVMAKYIDSAMSKTINLPNEFSFEDFKGVYDKIYDSGLIKGCTTYRDGTMMSVLSETSQQAPASPSRIMRTKAPRRPKVLECDIHHLNIMGDKWLVFIGLYGEERDPYEVFAFKRNGIQISPKITTGKMIKVKQRNHHARYDLELDGITIEDVCSHFKSGEESALTRMISTALRHGADMDYVYDQLNKAEGTIVSFSKAIARSIKKYVKTVHDKTCPACHTENALVISEGCIKCTVCSYSACT